MQRLVFKQWGCTGPCVLHVATCALGGAGKRKESAARAPLTAAGVAVLPMTGGG